MAHSTTLHIFILDLDIDLIYTLNPNLSFYLTYNGIAFDCLKDTKYFIIAF